MAVEALQLTVAPLEVILLEAKLPGAVGAVAAGAGTAKLAMLEIAVSRPAVASTAFTKKVVVAPWVRFVAVKVRTDKFCANKVFVVALPEYTE